MRTPAVSVLMPVYDGERWIEQALASALAQTVTDFELVVVDDGSTDRSAAIVESVARRDSRVRLVQAPHAGLPQARRVSLAEARGDLVAFLDADDEWLPTRLERQLPHADGSTIVFADAYVADGDALTGRRYSEHVPVPELQFPASGLFPLLLVHGSFLPMVTVLAPRELLIDAGAFARAETLGLASTRGSCDWEMWLLLSLRGARFDYVDEPLAVYRSRPGSLSGDPLSLAENELPVFDSLMTEAAGADRVALRKARRRTAKQLEIAYRKRGWQAILAGDGAAAQIELVRSLRVRPRSSRAWLALALARWPSLARRVVRGRT